MFVTFTIIAFMSSSADADHGATAQQKHFI